MGSVATAAASERAELKRNNALRSASPTLNRHSRRFERHCVLTTVEPSGEPG